MSTIFALDQFTQSEVPADMSAVKQEAPRYIVFMGDLHDSLHPQIRPAGGLDLGIPVIKSVGGGPPGFLHRGLITPCVPVAKTVLKEEIPDGVRAFAPQASSDASGIVPIDLVRYALQPGPAVDRLLESHSRWGVTEIIALQGKAPGEVQAMRLNETIYPEWPKLPETHGEMLKYLQGVRESFSKTMTGQAGKLLLAVVDELIGATQKCDDWMRQRLDTTHGAMALPTGDSHKKSVYDLQDLHFLKRTGLQRRDQELRSIVDIQSQMAQALSKPADGTSMEAVREILAQQQEFMKSILARLVPAQPPAAAPPTDESIRKTGTKG